jgi:toxin FitB
MRRLLPTLAITIACPIRDRRPRPCGCRSRHGAALQTWLASALREQFADRVLPADLEVARAWGSLTTASERLGRPLHVVDGLLLATAQVHGLTMVARNVDDFRDRGVPVHDPYATPP